MGAALFTPCSSTPDTAACEPCEQAAASVAVHAQPEVASTAGQLIAHARAQRRAPAVRCPLHLLVMYALALAYLGHRIFATPTDRAALTEGPEELPLPGLQVSPRRPMAAVVAVACVVARSACPTGAVPEPPSAPRHNGTQAVPLEEPRAPSAHSLLAEQLHECRQSERDLRWLLTSRGGGALGPMTDGVLPQRLGADEPARERSPVTSP